MSASVGIIVGRSHPQASSSLPPYLPPNDCTTMMPNSKRPPPSQTVASRFLEALVETLELTVVGPPRYRTFADESDLESRWGT